MLNRHLLLDLNFALSSVAIMVEALVKRNVFRAIIRGNFKFEFFRSFKR